MKPKILLVEDEAPIRVGLTDVLVFHGFDVQAVDHGGTGLELARGEKFDLLLLDVMLPGVDGFEICRQIREVDRDQPIIMLTARDTDEDVINGLSLGADDYVTKPFSVAQLVLRIKAVLRRSGHFKGTGPLLIKLACDVTIDPRNLSADVRGETVAFTRREMDVVEYLNAHRGRPVSRDELLSEVWGYDPEMMIETRTVDIHIARLRRKLEADSAEPQFVVTVRGAGYRLDGD